MTGLLQRAGCLMLLLCASTGARAMVPILPLDEIKPGMKGVGRTVFEGTRIDEFDVTVIGVMKSFDFQMDMILIRVESGPVVEKKMGIVGGMSGSPIYIDGKLIGALAYGWSFQIEPIAGVTPIEQMLEQYDPQHPAVRSARERRAAAVASPMDLRGTLRPAAGTIAVGERRYDQIMVAPNAEEAAFLQRARPDLGVLRPVATPVYVSGMGGRTLRELEDLLAPYNLVPMQAGSTAVPADTPFDLAPGAAVGVPIASGDIDMSAVGTLTYLDEGTALAFGHPFFGFGGVELPFSSAFIHTVISSQYDSNKMGGLIAPIGTLTQDRPTCVGARLGPVPTTIPVEYRLTELDRDNERVFRVQMARQPQVATMFCVQLMNGAMENVAGAEYDGVIDSRVEISARPGEGEEPLTVVRMNSFSEQGTASFGTNPLVDLYLSLSLLRENPFGEATVESVKVDLRFTRERKTTMIERAQATRAKVHPGDTLDVVCDLKPFGGESEPHTIAVQIPANAPLGPLGVVLIGGGDSFTLRPMISPPPTPTDVKGLFGYLTTDGRSDAIFCELMLASNGLEFGGRRLADLPEPVTEALLTTSGESLSTAPDVVEQVHPLGQPVSGVGVVMVEVVGPEGETGEGGEGGIRGFEPPEQGMRVQMGAGPMGLSTMAALSRLPRLAALVGPSQALADARAAQFGERIAWAAAPIRASQQRALQRLRRGTQMAQRAWRPRAEAPADAAGEAPADSPAAEEAPAEGADEPDVTDALDLDTPPAMPGWRELRAVEKGDLGLGEEPAGDAAGGGEESSEDEPLARPVSVWSTSGGEEFGAGRFTGTYLTEDGSVAMAPVEQSLGRPKVDRAYAVLPRPDGSVLTAGWGEEATVHRLAGDQITEVLSADGAGVSALCALDDQTVLAAVAPTGAIYRLSGDAATLFVTLPEPCVWAMVPDGAGGVYAATGNHGRLYRIASDGATQVIFESRDRHLLALCAAPGGGVYTGAFPTGRVYKVGDGGATSVFQAEEAGVLSLAATPSHLYIGTAGTGQVYRLDADGNVQELLEGETGNIYALAASGETVYAAAGQPGRILRFNGTTQAAQVYRTDEPLVLGLAATPTRLVCSVAVSGELLALDLGGAERGTYVSAVHDAGVAARWGVARWAYDQTNDAAIVLETRSGNSTTPDAAWSNWSPGMVELDGQAVSSPPARYIQYRALFYGKPGDVCALERVSLHYRTINRAPSLSIKSPAAGTLGHEDLTVEWEAEDPDEDKLTYRVFYAPAGTEEWRPVVPPSDEEEEGATAGDEAAGEAAADSPDEPAGDQAPDAADATPGTVEALLERAGPRYAALRTLVTRRGLRLASTGSLPLVSLIGAAPPEAEPTAPPAQEPEPTVVADEGAEPLEEESVVWDTTTVPDGVYRLKIVASDERRNPDDPREAVVLSGALRIDNTAPSVGPAPAEGPMPVLTELALSDSGSWLSSAEYRLDDGQWRALLPADGIFDSPSEVVRLPAISIADGPVTLHVRLRDAAGNVGRFDFHFDGASQG